MRKYIILLVNLAFCISLTAGGGWPQKKGNGFYKLSAWNVRASSHYTSSGQIDPNITSGIFNLSLYGEHGITDRLTAQGYFPFYTRAYANNLRSMTTNEIIVEGDALNWFGDAELGLKYGILVDKKVALAATFTQGFPLGKDNNNPDNYLQTGDKEWNQIIQVDAGIGLGSGKISGYANAYLGFNNRNRDVSNKDFTYSDEIRYGIEGGVGFLESKLWVILRITGVESLKNGSNGENSPSTSIFANNTEFTSPSLEVSYKINDMIGVSASAGGAFRGELIYASPAYSVGVFMDLKKKS